MKLRTNDKNILAVSDLQIPFEHPDAYAFIEWLTEEYEPDEVVYVGDEVDQHALSRYDHDPDGITAGEELEESIERLKKYYALHPEAKCCTSNHTDRVFKKAFSAGIPRGYLKSIREFLQAPEGWEWRDEWRIDGIRFSHGDEVGGQVPHRTLALAAMTSCVIGHHHSTPGVHFIANRTEAIFGMNVGCLIDVNAYAFHYTRKQKNQPVLGAGLILSGVPKFVPMITTKNGRWDWKNQKRL